MKDKIQAPPKKRNKGSFRNLKKHSDKMTDYRVDKKDSVQAMAQSPEQENKADVALRRLIKNEPYPTGKISQTNDRRYSWLKAGAGRKA